MTFYLLRQFICPERFPVFLGKHETVKGNLRVGRFQSQIQIIGLSVVSAAAFGCWSHLEIKKSGVQEKPAVPESLSSKFFEMYDYQLSLRMQHAGEESTCSSCAPKMSRCASTLSASGLRHTLTAAFHS
jgi:hypothetical protein